MADRERFGREASLTAAVLDAQSARSGGVGVKGVRGCDAGKKVSGRRRHALVDTDGRLLLAAVSPACLHDSHGGAALLAMSLLPSRGRTAEGRLEQGLWCRDPDYRRSPLVGCFDQVTRTYSGRPSWSILFSAATAIATLVARLPLVRDRSPSPITCLNLLMSASTRARKL